MAKLLCATIFASATLTCSAECRADELWSCRTKYENGDAFAARFQINGDKLVPIGGSIQFQIIENNTEHVLAWYSFLDKNRRYSDWIFLERSSGNMAETDDIAIVAMDYKDGGGPSAQDSKCVKM